MSDDDDDIDDAIVGDPPLMSLYEAEQAESLRFPVMNAEELRGLANNGWDEVKDLDEQATIAQDEHDDFQGYIGPSREVASLWESPIALFHFYLPPYLWTHIAAESNKYRTADILIHAKYMHINQIKMSQRTAGYTSKEPEELAAEVMNVPDITPVELKCWIGLLIGHMLLKRKHLRDHWKRNPEGTLPAGTFGPYMRRGR